MKAAVFLSQGSIEIQDLANPAPRAGEVVVRVAACGVCGTDVHIYQGHLKEGIRPPVVLGHEIAGVIEAVGEGVKRFQPGQNVCVDPVVGCGCCQYCHIARTNLCEAPTIIGYVRNGGFAQYVVAPQSNIYPLAPDTPAAAGILVETLACVLNGYDKLDLKPGRTALVLGAGTVGLLWNQVLRRSPITLLAQAEPVAMRRERARQLGADAVIDTQNENMAARAQQIAPGGFDYVVDASGNPDAVELGVQLVKKGGTFLIFGVCPADATIRINPHDIYQKEMRICSSKMPPFSLHRAVQMVLAGLIDYRAIVSDALELSMLPHAIDAFESARDRHIKIAIEPWKTR